MMEAAGAVNPRGVTNLAVEDDRDDERGRKPALHTKKESLEKSSFKKKRPVAPEVGNALRSAYEQTVNEDIPPEMLDLLGKLG
ncbi:MAG TPA: hypothetical protein VGD10_07875 [Allosphingosinicella sp.]|uniref:NepR family anti-sigma factor n=1 Tax=Allosphingosinicella sp. TaxID=2823234 RepID=UPI002ED8C7BC